MFNQNIDSVLSQLRNVIYGSYRNGAVLNKKIVPKLLNYFMKMMCMAGRFQRSDLVKNQIAK